jgi:hypothetical protein
MDYRAHFPTPNLAYPSQAAQPTEAQAWQQSENAWLSDYAPGGTNGMAYASNTISAPSTHHQPPNLSAYSEMSAQPQPSIPSRGVYTHPRDLATSTQPMTSHPSQNNAYAPRDQLEQVTYHQHRPQHAYTEPPQQETYHYPNPLGVDHTGMSIHARRVATLPYRARAAEPPHIQPPNAAQAVFCDGNVLNQQTLMLSPEASSAVHAPGTARSTASSVTEVTSAGSTSKAKAPKKAKKRKVTEEVKGEGSLRPAEKSHR